MWFRLHESVKLVLGAKRAALYDLAHGVIRLVPKDLCAVVQALREMEVSVWKERLSAGDQTTTTEYLDWLVGNDYGIMTDEPAQFIERPDAFEQPWLLHNAILECEGMSIDLFRDILQELASCRCQYMEMRHYHRFDPIFCSELLETFPKYTFRGIRLVVPAESVSGIAGAHELLLKYRFIYQIILHGSDEESTEKGIATRKEPYTNAFCCGRVESNDFIASFGQWAISKNKNNCLHGKISINPSGGIRMCPAAGKPIGHIGVGTNLKQVAQNMEGSPEWNMTKDAVDVCKDCEFRYACTDCRMIRSDPNDLKSKPLKCGYNPYTCEWKDWSDEKALLTMQVLKDQFREL